MAYDSDFLLQSQNKTTCGMKNNKLDQLSPTIYPAYCRIRSNSSYQTSGLFEPIVCLPCGSDNRGSTVVGNR